MENLKYGNSIIKEKKIRNTSIDILRFIGLAMIIFAHIDPPGFLFQLRNFDVPLMVLISGMSFGLSYKESEPYSLYLWKRFKRLIFPVWIFLTVYFLVEVLLSVNNLQLNSKKVLESYFLLGGIGYVWIIRVFILVALISPFIFQYNQKQKSDKKYFGTLILCFLIYEIIRYISLPYIRNGAGSYVSLFTHYIIPYGIVFAIGLRIPSITDKQVGYLAFFNLCIVTLCGAVLFFLHKEFMATQIYKYPPSIYYISYALFVSCLLWKYSNIIERVLDISKTKGFVMFCAQNSIWVYLWHIPFIEVFNIKMNVFIKYGLVVTLAVMMAFIQVSIINIIIK